MLHTRISQQLAEDIRALAEDLRVPVSNLVRNVLEEAFSVVEEVTEDVGEILEDVIDQAEQVTERLRRSQERRRERGGSEPPATERGRRSPSPDGAPHPPMPGPSGGEAGASNAAGDPAASGAHPDASSPSRGASFPEGTEPGGNSCDAPDFSRVVAWQPVILHAPQRCAFTGRPLGVGEQAYMGVTHSGPAEFFLSREGLDRLH